MAKHKKQFELLNALLTRLSAIAPETLSPSVSTLFSEWLLVFKYTLTDLEYDLVCNATDRAFLSYRAWKAYGDLRACPYKPAYPDTSWLACRALMHAFEAIAYTVADSPHYLEAWLGARACADLIDKPSFNAEPPETEELFICKGCGREELACSKDPCPDVMEDRQS